MPLFNSFYAALLYATFDLNNDGWLSMSEATKALNWLRSGSADGEQEPPMAFAFPSGAMDPDSGEPRLGPDWFWAVFRQTR